GVPFRSALSIRARELHRSSAAHGVAWRQSRNALHPRAARADSVMSTPLLEVENVGRQFVARRSVLGRPTAIVTAGGGVSFSLEAGKTLALVGESGSGKSTLGRLVLRLIDPTAGCIRFDGRDVTALKERELKSLRRDAQIIFQDPYASLNPRMTIGQILSEPLALHAVVPPSRPTERVGELLRLPRLDPRGRPPYPHGFSGRPP